MKSPHYLLASLIYFGIACGPVFAQSPTDSRIQRLEESIKALEQRVASLEAQLHERTIASQERPSASQGSPTKANWRKLKSGMAQSEVEQLLGSPEKIEANEVVVVWWYPRWPTGGLVKFAGGSHAVSGWSEPSH
jgi:hypothetical protein